MAGIQGAALPPAVALSAATAKTVVQLVAAANHRVKVLGWGVFFDGATSTATPVLVELLRQTSAGTMTALTLVKTNDPGAETLQTSAQHTATVEPTAGNVVSRLDVPAYGGMYQVQLPPGQEIIMAGGERLGIRCTAPATVNAVAELFFEE